uniref:Uncharacterized protein n=1 Tax=Oryza brachyantha TaxID=4533 RepID=J3MSE5_ORYBR
MQTSVAVSEALEAGKLSSAPEDGALDFAVAWVAVVVVSLAVAAACVTPRRTSPTVGLVGFLAAAIAAGAALAILVLLPIYDALVLGEEEQLPLAPVAAAGEEARELDR